MGGLCQVRWWLFPKSLYSTELIYCKITQHIQLLLEHWYLYVCVCWSILEKWIQTSWGLLSLHRTHLEPRGWQNVDFGYTVTLQIKRPQPTPQKRRLLTSYVKKLTQLSSMLHFWSFYIQRYFTPYPYRHIQNKWLTWATHFMWN